MIDKFRKKYLVFAYESYKSKLVDGDLLISFFFKIEPGIYFSPEICIKKVPQKRFKTLNRDVIDNFIFHLGLMEIPSYWKATCSPKILIKAGSLDEYQIDWWRDLLLKGMGQFFYENRINFKDKEFVTIRSKNNGTIPKFIGKMGGDKALVPIGGGKDSVVTLKTLTEKLSNIGAFVLNPTPASSAVISLTGVKNVVSVDRTIDKKLLELNAKGFLNGHTPFSAYLAFLSIFVAYLFGYKNVAFSNERGAEEGNVEYLGEKINHQYSKTFEFENEFRDYNQKYLSNINYFSFLRPLYEIQISEIFSRMDSYFTAIRSCNIGQKTNSWCCKCPKCLSTFILLYPFLGHRKIVKVFPRNLFENKELSSILDTLILKDRIKPFECVGTREEIKTALFLSLKKNGGPLLEIAQRKFLKGEGDLEKRAKKLLNSWKEKNNLNKKFESILREVLWIRN